MEKFCQTEKCQRERELQKQRAKERRFNTPLKLFMERKYPEIYAEYGELYDNMEAENPNRKNLATSPTFKRWLAANPAKKPAQTTRLLIPQVLLQPLPIQCKITGDIISTALQETFGSDQPGPVAEHLLPQPEAEANNNFNDVEQIMDESMREGDLALQGLLQPLPLPQREAEANNNFNVVDQIIDEMMRERDLVDFLEQNVLNFDGDEGIGFDHFVEIADDIEPFDYFLEVEPFDF